MEPNPLKKIRNHVELLWEDISLEQKGYKVAFYFDTLFLQRAAIGYKDYYIDDVFRADKFKTDVTLVCSLVSGGFIGQFRLLAPHEDEFLDKINSHFDWQDYDNWRDEVTAFVADTDVDLNSQDFFNSLEKSTEEELIKRFDEHAEMTKKVLNVCHNLLPWDRRLTGWERKKLLITDAEKPNYEDIFATGFFETLKDALQNKRGKTVSNFVDAAALSILILQTRAFNEGRSKLAPRFFLPKKEFNTLGDVLSSTGLIDELNGNLSDNNSAVLRDEDYFLYRASFRTRQLSVIAGLPAVGQFEPADLNNSGTDWEVDQIKDLYDKASAAAESSDAVDKGEIDFGDLSDNLKGMESYSFLRNVWIEFIKSRDLEVIVSQLNKLKQQFDKAQITYREMSFAEKVKTGLRKTRSDIFEDLDRVKHAGVVWEEIESKAGELRKRLSANNWDSDALFRNLKLYRYGFPERYRKEIKLSLRDFLSHETEHDVTVKAINKLVNQYMKVRSRQETGAETLTRITAIFCALELKDKLRKLIGPLRNRVKLHYSLRIALAGAELDLSHFNRGLRDIEDLETLWCADETPPLDKCNIAIGLTYLYYYAWVARKKEAERKGNQPANEAQPKAESLIKNAIVYAQRARNAVGNRDMALRVYVENQYLFCMVEAANPDRNREMKEAFARLNNYETQSDVWSYMYYDTLARYQRWRALEQSDDEARDSLMRQAIKLSSKAGNLAPSDEEVMQFHNSLLEEGFPLQTDNGLAESTSESLST
jgi:hypothetical protein